MKTKIAILLSTLNLSENPESGEFQILPAGQFRASDGRPTDVKNWEVKNPNVLLQKIAARKNDFLVDFEHRTLQQGAVNPAAGWIKPSDFRWIEGKGLFVVKCEWTPQAKAFIENKEYRYISPVFVYDPKTGEVLDVLNVALTNNPALDGMKEVISAAAKIGNDAMDPKLLELLGLAPDADENAVFEAVKKLKDELAAKNQDVTNKDNQTQALSSAVTALTQEVAKLKTQVVDDKKEALIAANRHKLVGLEKWATTQTIDQLENFLACAPNIVPATMQTDGNKPAPPANDLAALTANLTEIELKVAATMGQTPEQFAKAKLGGV